MFNRIFLSKMDSSLNHANEMTSVYVVQRLKDRASDVEVDIKKVANIVTFSVSGKVDGNKLSGSQDWTENELLTSDKPVTKYFDDVLRSVFGAENVT